MPYKIGHTDIHTVSKHDHKAYATYDMLFQDMLTLLVKGHTKVLFQVTYDEENILKTLVEEQPEYDLAYLRIIQEKSQQRK